MDIPDRVIIFDGVCNLCTRVVQFILKRDKKQRIRFASVQSSSGGNLLEEITGNRDMPTSVIYYRNGQTFYRSTAVLEILRDLDNGWPVLYVLKILPVYLRDALYRYIALRRYRLFGKSDTCYIPEKPYKHLFYND